MYHCIVPVSVKLTMAWGLWLASISVQQLLQQHCDEFYTSIRGLRIGLGNVIMALICFSGAARSYFRLEGHLQGAASQVTQVTPRSFSHLRCCMLLFIYGMYFDFATAGRASLHRLLPCTCTLWWVGWVGWALDSSPLTTAPCLAKHALCYHSVPWKLHFAHPDSPKNTAVCP